MLDEWNLLHYVAVSFLFHIPWRVTITQTACLQDVLPYINSGPQIICGAGNTPSSRVCNPAMLVLKNWKYWRPLEAKHTWKTFSENWSMGPKTEIHTYTCTNTNCLQFLSCCKIMHKLTVFVHTHTHTHTHMHIQIHTCLHSYIHTDGKQI